MMRSIEKSKIVKKNRINFYNRNNFIDENTKISKQREFFVVQKLNSFEFFFLEISYESKNATNTKLITMYFMLIIINDKNELKISNCDNVTKIVNCHMSLKKSINFFANMRNMYLLIYETFFVAMSLNDNIVIEQILFERMN